MQISIDQLVDRSRILVESFRIDLDRFRLFRVVSRSFLADYSSPKKFKFQLARAGPEPGRLSSRPEPSGPSPGQLKSAALRCSAQACQVNMLLYTGIKLPVITCLGGGQQSQRIKLSLDFPKRPDGLGCMLAPFFALGCFLAASCRSCCVVCRSCPVFVRLAAHRTRFLEGFGKVRAWF